MKTRVTELLGIDFPIIQGGMAWVANHHLAGAVSDSGALGLIGASSAPAEIVRQEIRQVREMTSRPFGVNIMLMSPYAQEVAQMAAEEKVPVITTGAGNPEPYMEMWKEAGIRVIPVVASVSLARRMERLGADALVAEGCEAGGHIGEITTMNLGAPGGRRGFNPGDCGGRYRRRTSNGRGLYARSRAVQMGTRFIADPGGRCP